MTAAPVEPPEGLGTIRKEGFGEIVGDAANGARPSVGVPHAAADLTDQPPHRMGVVHLPDKPDGNVPLNPAVGVPFGGLRRDERSNGRHANLMFATGKWGREDGVDFGFGFQTGPMLWKKPGPVKEKVIWRS